MSDRSSDAKVELRDLVVAVKDVTEWYELGLQLCLPIYILDKINSNPDFNSHMRQMLHAWLQHDPEASWEKLAAALATVGKNVVAETVRTTFLGFSAQQHSLERSRHDDKKSKFII